jgi:cyclopropane fatty-acyl-phospholipid synthase-like methyltransferase
VADSFEIVRKGYDALGERYRDWSHLSQVRLQWVGRLLEELPADSLVVELGCGAGEPATRLLSQRHRVLGVDASMVQLLLAGRAAPRALLVQADFTRLALRPRCVDAVASFYALGHVPGGEHARLFERIAQWLRPGGLLLTSTPVDAGDSRDDDWLGVPMSFGGIGEAATDEALARAGLTVQDWQVVPEDEAEGQVVRFLWLVARKPGQLEVLPEELRDAFTGVPRRSDGVLELPR